LQWSVNPPTDLIKIVSPSVGDSVIIETGIPSTAKSEHAFLAVTVEGAPSGTQVQDGLVDVMVLGSVLEGDRIDASHTGPSFPTAGVADGHGVGGLTELRDVTRAFASEGELADLTQGTAPPDPELALFSPTTRADYGSVSWGTSNLTIDKSGLGSPVNVPVILWIAVQPAHSAVTLADARRDFDLATRVFAGGRTGIALQERIPASTQILGPITIDGSPSLTGLCGSPQPFLGFDPDTMLSPTPPIHVVYVEKIGGVLVGFACDPPPGQTWGMIFVERERPDSTILAHELGHATGLRGYKGGHTTELGNFRSDNVMWTGERGMRPDERMRFTLGRSRASS
jgi:hypothetical protein